jgi:diguanylate cyclase (GGDEF)-like protein/PAS domain S-box-containing protein
MLNERRIIALIVTGYVLILALILGFGQILVSSMSSLRTNTDNLYRHPFTVSNAAWEMKGALFEIRNKLLQVVLIRNRSDDVAQLMREMDDSEQTARTDLGIVRAKFLGDMGRIKNLERLLDQWKTIRTDILRLEMDGKQAQAEAAVKTVGTPQFNKIIPEVNYVADYAHDKAKYFNDKSSRDAADTINRAEGLLITLIIIICATGLALAYLVRYELRYGRHATRELAESERRLRDILDNAPISTGIATLPEGRITQVNQAYCSLLGYSAEEMKRLTVRDITHPDDREATAAYMQQLLDGERNVVRVEKRFMHKDGRSILTETTVTLHIDDKGNRYAIAQLQNIEERKQFEEQLRQSENKFHTLFESANDCLMLLTADGRIADINRVGHERLGYTKEEMLGRRISEFDPPEFSPRVPERVAAIMRDGQAAFESAHVRKDGSRMPVEINATLVELNGEKVLFSIIRDITEHKAAEQALRASEAQYRAVIETSADGFWIVDMEGRLLEVNDAYAQLTGYSREELLSMRIPDIEVIERPEETAAHIEKIMREGHDRFETVHRAKDGRLLPVEIVVNFWHEVSDRLFVFVVDIAERKAAEQTLRASEAQYRSVIETSANGFWIVDMEARLLEVNDAYVQLSGYSREELLSMRIPDLEVTERPEETAAHIEKILREGHDRFETIHRAKDGRLLPVEIVSNFWPEVSGRLFVFITDITERKKSIEHINLLARVFEDSVEAMLITDAENNITDVNAAFTQLTGYTPEEVIGKNPNILSSGAQTPEFYREMWRRLLNEGYWQGEIWDRRKDGSTYPKLLSISVVRNARGDIVNHIASFTDISERKRAENEIRQLAYFDTLTGLHNRLSLITQLEQELARARRNQKQLALMFIDLDRFKVINDTLGHRIGDGLLVEVAGAIRNTIRESDLVARLGGDEFVVLLTDIPHIDEAGVVAGKLTNRISRPYIIDGNTIYTSPSIGISAYPEDGTDVSMLMQHADLAMYHAKSSGGNQFQFFDAAMNDKAVERLHVENRLRRAVEYGELELYYQPQITLDGRILGVEALTRWNHPEQGLLLPDKFIPVAEETGLILPIGRWVLETACRQLRRWRDKGLPLQKVAINLSAQEFLQDAFVESVTHIIADAGVRPHHIELEITESIAINNPDHVISTMNAMKAAGIRIAMDDFGIGYSSLSYLKLLPIDLLKIDRSFIRDLESDRDNQAIIKSTIELAHALGIEVAAEGVETEWQATALASHGCDLRQGYYYSKPLPVDELERFLAGMH